MKKIFTLISVALVAMSVNAQEVWKASDLTFDEGTKELQGMVVSDNKGASYVIPQDTKQFPENTYPDNVADVTTWLESQPDPSIYSVALKEYTFTASTDHVTLKAVSTPNADKTAAEAWQFAGADDNKELSAEGYPTFKGYVKPNTGNPSVGYYDYYDTNGDGGPVHRVSDVIWEDGSAYLPAKGCYYEFTCSQDGPLTIAVFWPKNLASNPVYIIDESTGGSGSAYQRVPASQLTIKGYRNNNGWEKDASTGEAVVGKLYTFTLDNDGFLQTSTESTETNMNQPLFAYVTWNAQKDVTYMVMTPKNQPGLLGFQFTPSASGIESINATKADNPNAPIYNLAGQQVTKSYKGVVIQNGKKSIQK